MKAIKPIVFCSFVLAALSMTQMEALARGGGEHHDGRRGDFSGDFTAQNQQPDDSRQPDDPSKYHTVLNHPESEESPSGFAASGLKEKGPKTITLDGFGTGVSLGDVHEDIVSASHPESKTQKKQQQPTAETTCSHNPNDC